jgi:hypothetical protein
MMRLKESTLLFDDRIHRAFERSEHIDWMNTACDESTDQPSHFIKEISLPFVYRCHKQEEQNTRIIRYLDWRSILWIF